MAILTQGPISPEALTIEDLCYYGRHPHKSMFARNSKEDEKMVNWALEVTGMKEFAHRTLDAVSGGQRQRAWIAMALAQGTDLLLLDEPTTYLDIAYQIEVLELLRKLNREYGTTIVMVLHELNQAARYADYLISIINGEIYKVGSPTDIFTEEMIKDVFGLDSYIMEDPIEKNPMCIPIGYSYLESSKRKIV